jgi:hypothetical protein
MSPESHPPPTLGRVHETVDAIYRSDSRRILEWLREEVLEPVPHHHVVLRGVRARRGGAEILARGERGEDP